MNTKNSEQLFARAKQVSPGGVHSPVRGFRGVGGTPRFIESANGVRMKDADGNEYIDFCMSWGPLLFGHQDPEIAEAVKTALSRGWSYGTAERYSLEFAESLTETLPFMKKVRFVSSGTEAVMSALRVARGFTGRDKILKFDGCYHGHVDSLLVRAGSGLAEMASPDSAGVSKNTAAETIVCRLDDDKELEQIFATHGKELAAAIIEPLPANNGLLLQRTDFLKKLADLCHKNGSVLIFDEVISGFRAALGGMVEVTGITPDLVTYGKIIGGGFPVGAYGGKSEIMDFIAPAGPVYQAGTLSANPVAMSAGHAMLKKIIRDKPYAKLAETSTWFADEMQKLAKEHLPYPSHIQRFGSIFWMVCGEPALGAAALKMSVVRAQDQIPAEQKARFASVFHAMLNRGVYFAPSGYEVGFLSTAHTRSDLETVLQKAKEAFQEAAIQ